jgi:hypothetical protein
MHASVSCIFRCMLQMFHLNVSEVDRVCTCCNVTRLPQPPAAAAGAPCMCVGTGGMERCAAVGAGSERGSVGSDAGGPLLVLACSGRGRPDMGVCPGASTTLKIWC